MKFVFIRVHSWLSVFVFLGCLSATAADPISDALQKGLFEEEANHNLDAAIKAYQSVIDQTAEQRKLTATAVFRLGECYRKLNKTNEAVGQYQRLVREFSDQTNLFMLSHRTLAALGAPSQYFASQGSFADRLQRIVSAAAPRPQDQNDATTSEPSAATSAEAEEIEKIKAMIKYSPDLINSPHPSGQTPLGRAALNGYLGVARFLLASKAELNARDIGGATALHLAVSGGHKAMVELLLDAGADINVTDNQKNQPLHLAVSKGYRSIVELLLSRKADINGKGSQGRTPLHVAIAETQSAIARLLLERGADVNAQDDKGWTALHHAVSSPELTELLLTYKPNLELADQEGSTPLIAAAGARGNIRSVELLLKAGADVNKMTPNTTTPLMTAVWRNDVDKVRLLLEHKADPNQKLQMGGSPLKWVSGGLRNNIPSAEKAKKTEIADLLRKYGAKPEEIAEAPPASPPQAAKDSDTQELERLKTLFKENPDLVNLRDPQRETPLHKAAAAGHLKTAQFLLANGADPNAKEHKQATPLHVAVYVGQKDMVQLLATNGADPNAMGSYASMLDGNLLYGRPLHLAINEGRFAIVEILLAHGADPNGKAGWDMTPLHLAVDKGYFESARLLISKGADVNARDSSGRTPLLRATSAGQERAIDLLLQHKADINTQDNNGTSPLHSAVSQPPRLLNTLLARKPQLELVDEGGNTPLMWALRGNLRNAELLLKAGANPNSHSSKDRSLLFFAVHRLKNKDAVKLLLDYKADPNKPTPEGVTPLMYALDPINTAKRLEDKEPKPLTQAEQKALAEIVELLRAHGAKEHVRSAEIKP